MTVQLPEVLAQCPLLVNAEVLLVPEEDDTTCSNQAGKVVLLQIGEVGEINPVDLCADFRVIIEDIGGGREQVLEVRIAEQALVVIFDGGKSWPGNFREAGSEVLVFVCLIVLLNYSAAGNVVVDVTGRLEGDLQVFCSHMSDLGRCLHESGCHFVL
jgi:hypothetical protein